MYLNVRHFLTDVISFAFSINILMATILRSFNPWCTENMNLIVQIDWHLVPTFLQLKYLDGDATSSPTVSFPGLLTRGSPFRKTCILNSYNLQILNASQSPSSIFLYQIHFLSFPQSFLFSIFAFTSLTATSAF